MGKTFLEFRKSREPRCIACHVPEIKELNEARVNLGPGATVVDMIAYLESKGRRVSYYQLKTHFQKGHHEKA